MKKYAFDAHTIEWVNQSDKRTPVKGVRYCKGGGFFRLRNWLFKKLSTQWYQDKWELKRISYSRPRISQLIAEVMNRRRYKADQIEYVIMSHKTAFEVDEVECQHALTIGCDLGQGRLRNIYGIKVVVLPEYQGKEIIIVPKRSYR